MRIALKDTMRSLPFPSRRRGGESGPDVGAAQARSVARLRFGLSGVAIRAPIWLFCNTQKERCC
jgi:hypothetical protein